MTRKQLREHKIGNQQRRERLLKLYKNVKPSEKAWLDRPCFIQAGKYGTPNFDVNLANA